MRNWQELFNAEEAAGLPVDGVLDVGPFQFVIEREALDDREVGDAQIETNDETNPIVLFHLYVVDHRGNGPAGGRLDTDVIATALLDGGDLGVPQDVPVQLLVE